MKLKQSCAPKEPDHYKHLNLPMPALPPAVDENYIMATRGKGKIQVNER